MPKKAGIEVVIELRPQKPGPGIIVLTHSAEEENLRRALAAGAKGVEGGQNEFDRTHNCGCPALPQRAIWILHRALHDPPSVRNRSVEHCLGRHVMPSKTNPCLGASRDRKLASFNAQLTDARLVCKGRPGGFAMDGGRPIPSPL